MTRPALWMTLSITALFSSALGEGGGGGEEGSTVTSHPEVNLSCPVQLQPASSSSSYSGVRAVVRKQETALLLLLGFGGLSLLLALVHKALRARVYHDQHSLDTAFDAGGDVSLSLTAVTVASQLFWPVDILHSATLTVKDGVAGPFWYSVAVMINIFLFPIVSVQFKTRAPGAKTYLQIIRARFGPRCHGVMCFFALLVNVTITLDILLAGRAAIQALTTDASDEFCLLLMVTLFGSYSLVGGLGTTFYVSYFNAVLVFSCLLVFVVRLLHSHSAQWPEIGDTARVHRAVSCLQQPGSNFQHSLLTFRSPRAFLQGVVVLLGCTVLTYSDQAAWQSRIAARPVQGVAGFLLAGLAWFSIPNLMALTTGITYLALSSAHNATHLLTAAHVEEGLVTPLVAQTVLGHTGALLVLTMIAMALMSTGSGEVMAAASILVYDIYQPYIRPFRKGLKTGQCVLCGRRKKEEEVEDLAAEEDRGERGEEGVCGCVEARHCQGCKQDLAGRHAEREPSQWRPYSCPTHGAFRQYREGLLAFKSWCILLACLAMLPLGLAALQAGLDLYWMFFMGIVLTIPCCPPTLLSILWVKTTAAGVVVGSISGLVGGLTAVVVTTATLYEGGLDNFLTNSAQDYPVVTGTAVGLVLSAGGCVLVSLLTHRIHTEKDAEREWMKVYCLDNPLHPWAAHFRQELKDVRPGTRPSMAQMRTAFRPAALTAYTGGGACIAFFVLLLPALLCSVPVMNHRHFNAWMLFNQAWAAVMGLLVVLAPPAQEAVRVLRQFRQNRQLQRGSAPNNGGIGLMGRSVVDGEDGGAM